MRPLCPTCQRPFTPGATLCAACGASLLLEARPGDTLPVCAEHPTLRGLGTCERCGAFACARCLRTDALGGTRCARCEGLDPDQPLPWDQRETLGTLPAFWKTLVQVMLRPDTLRLARAEDSVGSSLYFTLLCALPVCVVTGLIYLGIFSAMPSLMQYLLPPEKLKGDGSGLEMVRWMGWGFFAVSVFLGPPLFLLLTLASAAVDHVMLRVTGGVPRGFRVTLRANALSQAAWTLGAIPFLGTQVAPFWALVSRVYAYRGLHRTTWGPAFAGALLAPLLSCCLCGGGYLGLLVYIFKHAP
ncbi:YIP1 family protein [Melittangium boletus]|uniref:YIP1 family protein n=1 Tax=Melittangium boletus TaxID=83453 RepID=UPI003DA30A60